MYGKHCFYEYILVCEKADSLTTTTSFKIMVEFMRVVFTGISRDYYCWPFRQLLLCSCDVSSVRKRGKGKGGGITKKIHRKKKGKKKKERKTNCIRKGR